jgi:predicted Rossmann fold nucleotide-binding protein DprA/Smf involved in DNA uptake
MTEFPPTTPPAGQNFPIRNRIISGLSQGTVVVEGDRHSGALITARTAILQGRTVYAFPGNVGEANTAGSNRLLIDGAVLILSAADVLEEYAFLYRDQLDMVKLKRAESRSALNEDFLDALGVCARTPEAESPAPTQAPKAPRPAKAEDASAAEVSRPAEQSVERKTHTRGKGRPAVEQTPVYRVPPTPAKASGDLSQQLLATLTETQRRIFEILPLDHAVPIDYITREGFGVGEVMSAMTILEIKGLTVTLPGGLFSRK